MKVIIQRVQSAGVTIAGERTASIGKGFLVLLGIRCGDTEMDARYLAEKCAALRVFEDENGKMNLSAEQVGGAFLVVSNFTLYADTRRGNRPGFTDAARPEEAVPLYEFFIHQLKDKGFPVETGVFGADMQLDLINDGPITIEIDSAQMKKSEAGEAWAKNQRR